MLLGGHQLEPLGVHEQAVQHNCIIIIHDVFIDSKILESVISWLDESLWLKNIIT